MSHNDNLNKKFVVFFDIDGTLIQPNQRPNSYKLSEVIKKIPVQKAVFGLNSNRSFYDIKNIYQMFALNGPIILENGVYFKKDNKSKNIFLLKNPIKIKATTKKMLREFVKTYNLKCDLLFTDTSQLIASNKLKLMPSVILVNKFREYTGSMHLYKYGKTDTKLAEKLVKFLNKYFKEHGFSFNVECTKSFGNVIFWPKAINKKKALKKLKAFYEGYTFVMIGDDVPDAKTLGEVKFFFAVGNAEKTAKVKANFVAKKTYTKGVIEIIHHFKKLL